MSEKRGTAAGASSSRKTPAAATSGNVFSQDAPQEARSVGLPPTPAGAFVTPAHAPGGEPSRAAPARESAGLSGIAARVRRIRLGRRRALAVVVRVGPRAHGEGAPRAPGTRRPRALVRDATRAEGKGADAVAGADGGTRRGGGGGPSGGGAFRGRGRGRGRRGFDGRRGQVVIGRRRHGSCR
jgi:hypothetical protein